MADVDRRSFLKATGTTGIAAGLAGCIGGLTGGSGGGNGKLNKVGVSMFVRGGTWITAFKEAAKIYAKHQDIKIDIVPNQQSATQQASDIRQFVNQGYDGIAAAVWATGAVESAIEYASQQGVPVFTANADATSSKVQMFVAFGNKAAGRRAGKQMVKYLRKQNPNKDTLRVLDVRGPFGVQQADLRNKGFVEVMKNHKDIQIADIVNAKFSRTLAQQKVLQWINANGRVDGIYSANLSMGLGVVSALRKLGLLYKSTSDSNKHITLTQLDGSPKVNDLIAKQYIDAAVDQPNYFYLPIAMHYMEQWVEGGRDEALPNVGEKVTHDTLDIPNVKAKGVNLWSVPIWAPATVKKKNNHLWFQTATIVITDENANTPYLWGNIWGGE